MRGRYSWLWLGLGSCSQLVELGTQCPDTTDACLVRDDAGEPPDGTSRPPPDAGAKPDATPDAMMPVPDTSVPASPFAFPDVGNWAFDLSSGVPGDVTTLSTTNIKPWYTCQPIGGGSNPTTAVRAESSVTTTGQETPPNTTLTAPDQSATFISMQYLVNLVPIPLVQTLGTPLEPGVQYGFALDALSTNPEAKLSLQLRMTTNSEDCLNLNSSAIGESAALTSEGWQKLCVPFSTTTETTHLVMTLKSGALLTSTLTGGRLLFDHLRPITKEECPELF